MSLSIKQLQAVVGNAARFEPIIRDMLRMIDARIKESDLSIGRNVIAIELEQHFNVPGLDKGDQQRFVYSSVIKSLKERDFEVVIELADNYTMLHVSFDVSFSEEQVRAMNATILEALVSGEQVGLFYSHGAKAVAKAKKKP